MKRRDVLGGLAGAVAAPFVARAQQPTAIVGFLNSTSPDLYAFNAAAFVDGLREEGFIPGQNVTIEYRWAGGIYDRLPALAADLVRRKVAVIAATGDVPSARAAQTATTSIPIVFTIGGDPVRFGLVSSLNRPEGNATGVTLFSSTLGMKRFEVLDEITPKSATIALLMNPDNSNFEADVTAAQEAAKQLGRQTVVVNASHPGEFEAAFQEIVRTQAGGILLASDPMFLSQRSQLVTSAAHYAIPLMYWTREFVVAGGLISYGIGTVWMYRQAGVYAARILKGEKVSGLPVVQPSKFDLVINLKTSRALGLDFPPSLLARADEVIE